MFIDNHILKGAILCPSPNHSMRPANIDIDLIVIHSISLPPGVFGNNFICDFFSNKLDANIDPYFKTISSIKVSSHILINRKGDIIQFVDFDKKAWHAGVSKFKNRENCNDFSIGIELEGDENSHYEKNQYKKLNDTIYVLCQKYPIKFITGHSYIAPERKKDPGAFFDWNKIDQNHCTVIKNG